MIKPAEGATITCRCVMIPSEPDQTCLRVGIGHVKTMAYRVEFDGRAFDLISHSYGPGSTYDAWDLQTGEVVRLEL